MNIKFRVDNVYSKVDIKYVEFAWINHTDIKLANGNYQDDINIMNTINY